MCLLLRRVHIHTKERRVGSRSSSAQPTGNSPPQSCVEWTHMCDRTEGASPADRLASASVAAEAGPSAPGPSDAALRCNCITERLGAAGWHCEDDPPPYASLINASPGHHQVTWSYVFPGLPGYDAAAGASRNGAPENRTIARPLVSIPLTSYGIFKIEPPRYAAAMPQMQQPQMPRIMMSEPGPAVKSSNGRARKYGAILIAATVIVFLMALSLMVRFVTEKSLLSRG